MALCVYYDSTLHEGGDTMATDTVLQDVVRKGELLDIYGALLTERQRNCMHLYFDLDLSLSEIAEELDVSRQSVSDMLRRTSKALDHYEDRLGILRQRKGMAGQLRQAISLLERQDVGAATQLLQQLVHVIDE